MDQKTKQPGDKVAPGSQGSVVRRDLVFIGTFIFLLLVLLGPMIAVGMGFGPEAAMVGQGSMVRQAGYILVAGFLFVVLKPWENYQRLLAIPIPLMIALGFCWLSLIWAIEPSVSLRRLILATMVMWTLFAAFRQLKFEEVVTILRWGMTIVLLCNYIAVWLFPAYGVHDGSVGDEYSLAGDWRGVLQHKNLAGAVTALTIIMFAFDRRKMNRYVQWAVLAAAGYFLYRTNSKTSFGLGVAAIMIGYLFSHYQQRYKGFVLAILGLLATAATILEALYQNPLLGKLDDPKAFTGRVQIWNGLLGYIRDHPLLGAGYGSFWDIGPASPIFVYGDKSVYQMPNGHNGFLDIAAQLGLPGLALIVFVAVIWPFRKMLNSPITTGSRGALLIATFFFCVAHNATESSIFDRDMTVWVILMVSIALSQPTLINYKRAKFDVHNLIRIRPVTNNGSGGKPRTGTVPGGQLSRNK